MTQYSRSVRRLLTLSVCLVTLSPALGNIFSVNVGPYTFYTYVDQNGVRSIHYSTIESAANGFTVIRNPDPTIPGLGNGICNVTDAFVSLALDYQALLNTGYSVPYFAVTGRQWAISGSSVVNCATGESSLLDRYAWLWQKSAGVYARRLAVGDLFPTLLTISAGTTYKVQEGPASTSYVYDQKNGIIQVTDPSGATWISYGDKIQPQSGFQETQDATVMPAGETPVKIHAQAPYCPPNVSCNSSIRGQPVTFTSKGGDTNSPLFSTSVSITASNANNIYNGFQLGDSVNGSTYTLGGALSGALLNSMASEGLLQSGNTFTVTLSNLKSGVNATLTIEGIGANLVPRITRAVVGSETTAITYDTSSFCPLTYTTTHSGSTVTTVETLTLGPGSYGCNPDGRTISVGSTITNAFAYTYDSLSGALIQAKDTITGQSIVARRDSSTLNLLALITTDGTNYKSLTLTYDTSNRILSERKQTDSRIAYTYPAAGVLPSTVTIGPRVGTITPSTDPGAADLPSKVQWNDAETTTVTASYAAGSDQITRTDATGSVTQTISYTDGIAQSGTVTNEMGEQTSCTRTVVNNSTSQNTDTWNCVGPEAGISKETGSTMSMDANGRICRSRQSSEGSETVEDGKTCEPIL